MTRARAREKPKRSAEPVGDSAAAIAQLEPLLQHRSRLGALALLAGEADALSFSRLKTLLRETDGNLGAQLRKLEEADLVSVRKEFLDRRPVSWYAITDRGRATLERHLAAIQSLIRLTRG